jgi:hypothetical protein
MKKQDLIKKLKIIAENNIEHNTSVLIFLSDGETCSHYYDADPIAVCELVLDLCDKDGDFYEAVKVGLANSSRFKSDLTDAKDLEISSK